jgi:hypothetical protein
LATKEEINTFSLNIESIAVSRKIPYLEAVLCHCQSSGLEIELAAKLISDTLKKKIEAEASQLNLVTKKVTKLPL